jgi:hypothetical protein
MLDVSFPGRNESPTDHAELFTHVEGPAITSTAFLAGGGFLCTSTLPAATVEVNLDTRRPRDVTQDIEEVSARARDDQQVVLAGHPGLV